MIFSIFRYLKWKVFDFIVLMHLISYISQGVIWILELDENVKDWMKEKLPKEQKKKRVDLLEVHPVRRFARIKDHKLILSDSLDGPQTPITLKGFFVDAVSGSGPTRKW